MKTKEIIELAQALEKLGYDLERLEFRYDLENLDSREVGIHDDPAMTAIDLRIVKRNP